ncbi:hypothetical protein ROI90_10420 [Hymenobacter sp. ZK17L-C2]|uniref:Uncharacterized protein n=1 Tax=Hymenobacter endophyticus TaxID=3076335 RepID=A0ABU3THF7_9BACT|nr:hypothetical protein [Hymenobacter endophyticus]
MHSQSETRMGPLPTLGATSAPVLPCLPASGFSPLGSPETPAEKKIATRVANSSEKLLPLHPASEGGALHGLDAKNFFRLVLGKRQNSRLPLHPGSTRRNGYHELETKKTIKTFLLRFLEKAKRGVTFAPRFNGRGGNEKDENATKFASKKSFQKVLQ